MNRLSRYLLVQFFKGALAFYLIALALIWMIQMLTLFDLVTAKGQNLLTLAAQSFLATPRLALEIGYICLAVGIARALKTMQESRELHTIHVTRRLGTVWQAVAMYCLIAATFTTALAHFWEPMARHKTAEWTAQIAAEVVGQTLTPNRYTEVAPGVVVRIGGRDADGTIRDFFADDHRQDDVRRTYLADSAVIVERGEGFQISLRNGRMQILPDDDRYSEIEFGQYELSVDSLTGEPDVNIRLWEESSDVILTRLLAGRGSTERQLDHLHARTAEILRVIGVCLMVASVMAFPHARRKRSMVPAEFIIIALSFGERSLSDALDGGNPYGAYAGPVLMLAAGVAILAHRYRNAVLPPRRRTA